MNKTEITITEARMLYVTANAEGKKMLENKFGVEALTKDFKYTLKTWELVCEKDGIDPVKSLPYPDPKTGEEKFLNACKKMSTISRVFREGKKHDWTNSSKGKYYPWWDLSSGSGLSYLGYDNASTFTAVGSRHCFFSKEDVVFVAEHFKDVSADLILEQD